MDKKFVPNQVEVKLYQMWLDKGLFEAHVDKKKRPFSIILPPPNANADLHLGHAMYVYEDMMIRYKKLKGFETLWLPGADHAGFETQFVFEKQLAKEGKSRFDYDRDTLYKMIWDFVMNNKSNMENQLKRLGFALDWSKKKFTLDSDIIKIVYQTFKKLYDQGLVYRAKRLVNYCTKDGTSFSDLEVVYKEQKSNLWFIKYPLKDGTDKYITVATTRPETMLGDTAVAVNPNDKRYKNLIGKKVILPLTNREIPIVADQVVDPEFGTGAVKVTPAHDPTDWEIGQRHKLEIIQVIDFKGRMSEAAAQFKGLKILEAREQIINKLKEIGLLEKEKEYEHRVATCYKCGCNIEPLPMEQWFVKIRPLASSATKLIEEDKIKIYPERFKKVLIQWLDNFHDWNISRQVVWGIRIPAYRCRKSQLPITNFQKNSKTEKNDGWFVSVEKPKTCQICGGCEFEQDIDTFDTWFSSSQWPYVTLLAQSGSSNYQLPISKEDKENSFFNYFYPTSVMETGYDILPWWVARMIMIGFFTTGHEPFQNVYLHGMVRDKKGQKMSKSKGNVINPIEMIDKYGADSLRASLVFGVGQGSDLSLSEEKIIGMRNFANKIWNIGRFMEMNESVIASGSEARYRTAPGEAIPLKLDDHKENATSPLAPRNDKKILEDLEKEYEAEKKEYEKLMDSFEFSKAFELVYEFLWHRFADIYIEQLKPDLKNGKIEVLDKLKNVYLENLKMLHPFMPYVTDAIWQVFKGENKSILEEKLSLRTK